MFRVEGGLKSSMFGVGGRSCLGSRFDDAFWDGESCRGSLLIG